MYMFDLNKGKSEEKASHNRRNCVNLFIIYLFISILSVPR